ncbi:GFA family protein [Maricaulis sp.]|uniref:GFA family protein n=1 Tax=Maricaulis sp. TaxID=1486257 RepID=UPI003299F995
MSVTTQGRCLCGASAFTAKLKSETVDACHCSMCQTWGSGPFMAVECSEAPVFDDDSALGVFSSSDWAERVFCKSCGTPLMWRMKDGGHCSVSAGALTLSDKARFEVEIFIDEKPAYYDFANDTRKMTGAEVIAAFTAGQEG